MTKNIQQSHPLTETVQLHTQDSVGTICGVHSMITYCLQIHYFLNIIIILYYMYEISSALLLYLPESLYV